MNNSFGFLLIEEYRFNYEHICKALVWGGKSTLTITLACFRSGQLAGERGRWDPTSSQKLSSQGMSAALIKTCV